MVASFWNSRCVVSRIDLGSEGKQKGAYTLSAIISQPPAASESVPPHVGGYDLLLPVEFKLGKRWQWVNDDAQLCAQAL